MISLFIVNNKFTIYWLKLRATDKILALVHSSREQVRGFFSLIWHSSQPTRADELCSTQTSLAYRVGMRLHAGRTCTSQLTIERDLESENFITGLDCRRYNECRELERRFQLIESSHVGAFTLQRWLLSSCFQLDFHRSTYVRTYRERETLEDFCSWDDSFIFIYESLIL